MRNFITILHAVKSEYESHPSRDKAIVCATGRHMNCDVLKLRKPNWTNDDLTKIQSPTGGIFFSIWITDENANAHRAEYNIHSYYLRHLRDFRIKAHDFCADFRSAFDKLSSAWPNVSTDFSRMTLMQGWFPIKEKEFAHDALSLMIRFGQLALIIDDLLEKRRKVFNRSRTS